MAKKQETDHIPETEEEFKAWFREMVKPVKSDPPAVFVMASAEDMRPFVIDFIEQMDQLDDIDYIALRKDNPDCGILLRTGRYIECWAVARTRKLDWYGLTLTGAIRFYSKEQIW